MLIRALRGFWVKDRGLDFQIFLGTWEGSGRFGYRSGQGLARHCGFGFPVSGLGFGQLWALVPRSTSNP